eukprot:CAMPEP_0176115966 /NCGR_PEP_ID=MMETSP0120_2-20121206/58239_1 /TAXON_ID=160619 /ORGANISM="Kryptoperidinium foliaceum, Strain CCMP 1326" /LENGTH=385 /DNA_ID=CAMNT_0017450211 /DNA_START=27 /DNA_END=1179 /DNA_ORIENTATION=+
MSAEESVALLMASMTCAMVCGRGEELPKIAARKLLMPLAAHAGCDAPAISDVGELIGAASAVRAVRGHCGAIAVATSRFCGGEAPETFDGAAATGDVLHPLGRGGFERRLGGGAAMSGWTVDGFRRWLRCGACKHRRQVPERRGHPRRRSHARGRRGDQQLQLAHAHHWRPRAPDVHGAGASVRDARGSRNPWRRSNARCEGRAAPSVFASMAFNLIPGRRDERAFGDRRMLGRRAADHHGRQVTQSHGYESLRAAETRPGNAARGSWCRWGGPRPGTMLAGDLVLLLVLLRLAHALRRRGYGALVVPIIAVLLPRLDICRDAPEGRAGRAIRGVNRPMGCHAVPRRSCEEVAEVVRVILARTGEACLRGFQHGLLLSEEVANRL